MKRRHLATTAMLLRGWVEQGRSDRLLVRAGRGAPAAKWQGTSALVELDTRHHEARNLTHERAHDHNEVARGEPDADVSPERQRGEPARRPVDRAMTWVLLLVLIGLVVIAMVPVARAVSRSRTAREQKPVTSRERLPPTGESEEPPPPGSQRYRDEHGSP